MADLKRTHIVMLCSPGVGHFIPFFELAKHLALHDDLTITLITTQPINFIPDSYQTILNSLPSDIRLLSLTPPPYHSLPESARGEAHIMFGISHNLPRLRELLRSFAFSDNPPVALFVDLFGVDAFDVAMEFKIHPYVFITSPCLALRFGLHLPQLDAVLTGEFRDIQEPLRMPGCPPIYPKDMPDVILDRGNIAYVAFVRILRRCVEAKGIALKDDEDVPLVYTVGPLVRTCLAGVVNGAECLTWLDNQPPGSVLYVSFGSGGTLTGEQVKELALGLEMSKQRFLWVVKTPHESKPNAAYFGDQTPESESSLEFLPDGFLARTKGLGLVVSVWAPQVEVLGHASVAGFMSHCGWNSSLESIVHGVPMVAWPLYAEQSLNALMPVDGLKVALRPQVGADDALVTRDEVRRVIKCLMEGVEGKELRERMKELSVAATKAVAEDGSSFKSISKLTLELKNL
ncbi:putative hydroquinone glucosyltransferase [Dioscorea sansibarensis]